jgi:hypothetical protein
VWEYPTLLARESRSLRLLLTLAFVSAFVVLYRTAALTYHTYHLYDTANYPEYLGKCHMINVPWVFTSMWFFIKALLDE